VVRALRENFPVQGVPLGREKTSHSQGEHSSATLPHTHTAPRTLTSVIRATLPPAAPTCDSNALLPDSRPECSDSQPQLANAAPYATSSCGRRNKKFQSDNPDLRLMVRHLNNGTQLQHASNNRQGLPHGVQRAVDKVANSVNPGRPVGVKMTPRMNRHF